MTLKNSLFNKDKSLDVSAPQVGADGIGVISLTAKLIKRNIWLLVLAAIGFLMNMPVAVALVWSNMSRAHYYADLESFADDMCTVFNIGSAMIISVGAILAAFVLFKYLHNRRQVDFYHSLPIRREKLYTANLLAGLLIFLVPYLVAHILALPLLAGSGMLTYIDMGNYITAIVMNIFGYVIMFALASLAMLLSGNLGGAAKVLFSIYAFCPILSAMSLFLGGMFLTDYAEMGAAEIALVRMSVIERYFVMMCNYVRIDVFWQDIVLGGLILVGAVLAGLYLYKKRDSECAGATLAFNWQKPLFKYPYVVLAGTLGAVVMYAAGDRSLIWLVFGLVFFTVFAAQAMEIAIARDFHAIKKDLRGALISLVLVGMIIGAYGVDIFGYEKWQPEADKVECVMLNYGAIDSMNFSNYRLQEEYKEEYKDGFFDYYSVNPFDYYYRGTALTIRDPENVAAMLEILNSEPVGYGEIHKQGDIESEDYYEYYDYNESNYSRVCFKMKNGGYKVRYMRFGGVTANFDTYKKLYDSEEIRAMMSGMLIIPDDLTVMLDTLEDYTAVYGYDFGPIHSGEDSAKVRELWNTYRREYSALSGEELIKTVPLGQVNFQIYKNYEVKTDGYNEEYIDWTDYWYHSVTVYPQMTDTIKALRGYYGEEVLGNQSSKYRLTNIMQYTPNESELQVNGSYKYDDSVVIPKVDHTTTETTVTYSAPQVTAVNDTVAVDTDEYVGRPVDISYGAEIIANTVSDNQLHSTPYYTPWRATDCLKYYDLTYYVGDGTTVVQTRYVLP